MSGIRESKTATREQLRQNLEVARVQRHSIDVRVAEAERKLASLKLELREADKQLERANRDWSEHFTFREPPKESSHAD